VEFVKWGIHDPKGDEDHDCIVTKPSHAFIWYNRKCDDLNYFICEQRYVGNVIIGT